METPRRNRQDLNKPSELAIQNAIWEVEKIGADVKLTDAVILLGKAKDFQELTHSKIRRKTNQKLTKKPNEKAKSNRNNRLTRRREP